MKKREIETVLLDLDEDLRLHYLRGDISLDDAVDTQIVRLEVIEQISQTQPIEPPVQIAS